MALPGTKQVSPIIYLIENGHKLSLEILIASGKKKTSNCTIEKKHFTKGSKLVTPILG